MHVRASILAVVLGFCVLAVQAAAAPAKGVAPLRPIPTVGPSPITADCRFLFVVDTSAAMQRYADGLYRTTHRHVATGLGGRMQEGDVFTVWTYADTVLTREFPLNAWQPELNVALANRIYEHLATQKFSGKSNLRPVFAELGQALAIATNLTIILISDGTDVVVGTPFDRPINVTYGKRASELRTAKMPFVTTLVAQQGEFTHWSVRGGLEDISLPMPVRNPFPVPVVVEAPSPPPTPQPVPPVVVAPVPKPVMTKVASVPAPAAQPTVPAVTISKPPPAVVVAPTVQVIPPLPQPAPSAPLVVTAPLPKAPPTVVPLPVVALKTNAIVPPAPAPKPAPVAAPVPIAVTNAAKAINPPPKPPVVPETKPTPLPAPMAKAKEELLLPAIPPAPKPIIPPALRQPKSLVDASNTFAKVELLRPTTTVGTAAPPIRPLEARVLEPKPTPAPKTNPPVVVAKLVQTPQVIAKPMTNLSTSVPLPPKPAPVITPLPPQPLVKAPVNGINSTRSTNAPVVAAVPASKTNGHGGGTTGFIASPAPMVKPALPSGAKIVTTTNAAAKASGTLVIASPRASAGGWVYLGAAVVLLMLAGGIIAYLLRPVPTPSAISQSIETNRGS